MLRFGLALGFAGGLELLEQGEVLLQAAVQALLVEGQELELLASRVKVRAAVKAAWSSGWSVSMSPAWSVRPRAKMLSSMALSG